MCAEEQQSARVPSDLIGARAIVQPLRILRAQSNLNPCTLRRRCPFWPHELCRCLSPWRQLSLLFKLRIQSQVFHFWIGPNLGLPLHQGSLVDDALRSIYKAW